LYIRELVLKNFRNYREETAHFRPGLCLVQGDNGQGKSNLLEAIFNLCLGRSLRNLRESDLVYWQENFYYLQGIVSLQNRLYKLESGYDLNRKRKYLKINGKNASFLQLAKMSPVVSFLPEDLELIRRGPEERRRFLDSELSRESPLYAEVLRRYNRAVSQKNQLLKYNRHGNQSLQSLLLPWNRQIIYFGSRIIQKRAQILSLWSKLAAQNYHKLFERDLDLKIVYNNPIGEEILTERIEEIEKKFAQKLALKEKEELSRGFSLIGPHRDDFIFLISGREARRFASHGQQRSAIIALKSAQIQLYKEKIEKPLFILDDIFSELDETRKKQCLLLLKEAEQVFLTLTEMDAFMASYAQQEGQNSAVSFLKVKEGKIVQRRSYGED